MPVAFFHRFKNGNLPAAFLHMFYIFKNCDLPVAFFYIALHLEIWQVALVFLPVSKKKGNKKVTCFSPFFSLKNATKITFLSSLSYLKKIYIEKVTFCFFHGVILHFGALSFLNFGCICYRLWLRGAFQSKLSVWPGLRTVSTQRVLTHWEQKRCHLSGSLLPQCLFCSFLDKHAFANPFLLWCHGLMHAPFEVNTEWPNLFLRIMIRRWRSHSCRKKLHMPHHSRATWIFLNSKVWCVAAADANLQKNSNHLQFTVCFLVCADELQAKHYYHILSNDPRAHGICCEKRGKRLWIRRNLATCAGCPNFRRHCLYRNLC